jgi:hypothetical protein
MNNLKGKKSFLPGVIPKEFFYPSKSKPSVGRSIPDDIKSLIKKGD